MQGTEQQIAWAQKIKRQVVELAIDEAVQRAITVSAQNGEDDATCDARVKKLRASIKAAAETFDQATFWINARFANGAPCRETYVAINAIRAKAKEIHNG